MYKVVNGEVKGELFDPREIPEGWYDSPKAAKAALILKAEVKTKKQSCGQKTEKVAKAQNNDDSTGFNK
tara:strand:- start:452 stop:658 length:207 start_codon:yes stop_codon:yes gene_type:complete